MLETLTNWLAANVGLLLLFAALATIWWFLRSKATALEPRAGLPALLAGGKPVVVELFDNG